MVEFEAKGGAVGVEEGGGYQGCKLLRALFVVLY
jgi:hypothetical protein